MSSKSCLSKVIDEFVRKYSRYDPPIGVALLNLHFSCFWIIEQDIPQPFRKIDNLYNNLMTNFSSRPNLEFSSSYIILLNSIKHIVCSMFFYVSGIPDTDHQARLKLCFSVIGSIFSTGVHTATLRSYHRSESSCGVFLCLPYLI